VAVTLVTLKLSLASRMLALALAAPANISAAITDWIFFMATSLGWVAMLNVEQLACHQEIRIYIQGLRISSTKI
jgi:hypothetical protein